MGQIKSEYLPILELISINKSLSENQKIELAKLVLNDAMHDDKCIMSHPVAIAKFLATQNVFLEKSLSQVEQWAHDNEPVTMKRILDYILEKYLDGYHSGQS